MTFLFTFVSNTPVISKRKELTTSTCNFRPKWHASALGAGSGASIPGKPDDSSQSKDSSKNDQSKSFESTQQDQDDISTSSQQSQTSSKPALSNLGTADIKIDPVKGVPVSLIDATGAMQIDDGSLVSGTTILPRRLVKRRSDKKLDFASLRSQLAAGFNTGVGAAAVLTILFGLWYWANTAFNIYNKQVLKVFPYPLTCTAVQFAVAGVIMATCWLLRLKKPPRFNTFILRAALPLAFLHACGFVLTNMSLGKVSVAFTHTVKSTEPFFSVLLTPSILGDIPTWGIIGSLFPIVGGVALASATDVSFNWIGFASAIGSNIALQSRNVLSKRLMDTGSGKKVRVWKVRKKSDEELDTLATLDNVNLFSTMSILAFFVLLPFSLKIEGIPLLTSAFSSTVTGMSTGKLSKMLLLGGIYRCVDVLSSYMILKRVSPVTHSVGNCVKRAVVIVFSIFFFKTTMNALNIIGTILALSGVLMYSIIVSACKQNTFGPDSPFCKPIYDADVELTEGGGI